MRNAKLIIVAALVAGVSAAQAGMWNLDAMLDGMQEVPSNSSPGSGMFMGTYDDVTNNLVVTMYHVDGLTGTFSATHIHEGAMGTNGPVRVNFPSFGTVASMGSGSYMYTQTSPIVLTESVETAMLAGNSYVNFHTSTFPGGEVRGQIRVTAVPEPATMAALSLGALALIRRRRTA